MKKIAIFYLDESEDREQYERLLNNPECRILNEQTNVLPDGRVVRVVNYFESFEPPAIVPNPYEQIP